MPLLTRKRVLAAKIETTAGTAIAVIAADAAFNIYDAILQPTIETVPRPKQGQFSHAPASLGPQSGTCTFKVFLDGDGAAGAPAWADTFLPACGYKATLDNFAPLTEVHGSNVKTLTIAVYEDGKRKSIRGASGTFVINIENGKPIWFDFTFTGIWVPPTDAAILAPTYPTRAPIRAVSATFTIGSWTPCFDTMTIDAGNNVILRPCIDDAQGYKTAIITDRLVTGSFNAESNLVATEDVYGSWIALTEHAFSLAVGDGTDTVTLAAPKLQRTNVQEGDRDTLQIDTVDFQCNASAAAGNDEFTIDFS